MLSLFLKYFNFIHYKKCLYYSLVHTNSYMTKTKISRNIYPMCNTIIFSILFCFILLRKNSGCDPLSLFYSHQWIMACSLRNMALRDRDSRRVLAGLPVVSWFCISSHDLGCERSSLPACTDAKDFP